MDSSDGLVYDFSLVGGEGPCTIQHEEIVNMHLGTIPLDLGACQQIQSENLGRSCLEFAILK